MREAEELNPYGSEAVGMLAMVILLAAGGIAVKMEDCRISTAGWRRGSGCGEAFWGSGGCRDEEAGEEEEVRSVRGCGIGVDKAYHKKEMSVL